MKKQQQQQTKRAPQVPRLSLEVRGGGVTPSAAAPAPHSARTPRSATAHAHNTPRSARSTPHEQRQQQQQQQQQPQLDAQHTTFEVHQVGDADSCGATTGSSDGGACDVVAGDACAPESASPRKRKEWAPPPSSSLLLRNQALASVAAGTSLRALRDSLLQMNAKHTVQSQHDIIARQTVAAIKIQQFWRRILKRAEDQKRELKSVLLENHLPQKATRDRHTAARPLVLPTLQKLQAHQAQRQLSSSLRPRSSQLQRPPSATSERQPPAQRPPSAASLRSSQRPPSAAASSALVPAPAAAVVVLLQRTATASSRASTRSADRRKPCTTEEKMVTGRDKRAPSSTERESSPSVHHAPDREAAEVAGPGEAQLHESEYVYRDAVVRCRSETTKGDTTPRERGALHAEPELSERTAELGAVEEKTLAENENVFEDKLDDFEEEVPEEIASEEDRAEAGTSHCAISSPRPVSTTTPPVVEVAPSGVVLETKTAGLASRPSTTTLPQPCRSEPLCEAGDGAGLLRPPGGTANANVTTPHTRAVPAYLDSQAAVATPRAETICGVAPDSGTTSAVVPALFLDGAQANVKAMPATELRVAGQLAESWANPRNDVTTMSWLGAGSSQEEVEIQDRIARSVSQSLARRIQASKLDFAKPRADPLARFPAFASPASEGGNKKIASFMKYLDEVESSTDSPVTPVVPLAAATVADACGPTSSLYDSVKSKIVGLQVEVADKEKSMRLLQRALRQAKEQLQQRGKDEQEKQRLYQQKRDEEEKVKIAQQEAKFQEVLSRHLEFVDRLMSDKKELSTKIEKLTQDLESAENNYDSKVKEIRTQFESETKKRHELWAAQERSNRDKWAHDKAREIKEVTVKGLEPEINKLVAKHQQEMRVLEAQWKSELARQRDALNAAHATSMVADRAGDAHGRAGFAREDARGDHLARAAGARPAAGVHRAHASRL
eukprot:TRINITY_DN1678_c0_g1_i7.p1 TRINITY_DN1678_c0_g1~~TRINITY_DN1678_c0_g1_i7.p1  ORF type:complete len:954 (+),score=222.71 TRINITY_DN1678_c0_g1_i7:14-2875(+)